MGSVIEAFTMKVKQVGKRKTGTVTVEVRLQKGEACVKMSLPKCLVDRFEGKMAAVFAYCGAVKAKPSARSYYDLQMMMTPPSEGC